MRYLILVCLLFFIGCGSSESDQPENMMNDDGQGGAAGTEPLGGETPDENMGGEAGDSVSENPDENMGGSAGGNVNEVPDEEEPIGAKPGFRCVATV